MKIKNMTVLSTGASSGIGAATVAPSPRLTSRMGRAQRIVVLVEAKRLSQHPTPVVADEGGTRQFRIDVQTSLVVGTDSRSRSSKTRF